MYQLSLLTTLLLLATQHYAKAFALLPTTTTRTTWTLTPAATTERRYHGKSQTLPATARFASGNDVEETTEKYGLEAGLFESMKQKDGGESAKSLLKKYGVAYLATSIPLAMISFAICYVLVSNGVDVGSLLAKVGINSESGGGAETAGTFAIAYAAHKAASPIRFPPTVLLTPVVAKLIGKEPEEDIDSEDELAESVEG